MGFSNWQSWAGLATHSNKQKYTKNLSWKKPTLELQAYNQPPNQHGLEKWTGPELAKIFLACYRTPRFNTMFTTPTTYSYKEPIKSSPHPSNLISLRFFLILFSHPVVSFLLVPCQNLFPSGKPSHPSTMWLDHSTHPLGEYR